MNSQHQLTITAFVQALEQLQVALPESLRQQIEAISPHWESHVDQLEDLARQFEPLHHDYQCIRQELQAKVGNSPEQGTVEVAQPKVYRYALPANATAEELDAFQIQVEAIRQANPDWVVTPDRPQAGESDAITLIHKDEHYAQTHAAYIANRTLNEIVAPALSRVFQERL